MVIKLTILLSFAFYAISLLIFAVHMFSPSQSFSSLQVPISNVDLTALKPDVSKTSPLDSGPSFPAKGTVQGTEDEDNTEQEKELLGPVEEVPFVDYDKRNEEEEYNMDEEYTDDAPLDYYL